jgi:glucuronoarabinoxylan endo-1,4-beta-xylanase
MAKKTENCGNISGRQILVLLLLTSLITTAVEGAVGTVDVNTVYQQLEGFGASNVWSCYTLPGLGNNHPEIYDVIFGDLGLDILRTRNTYQYASDPGYIDRCAEVINDGRARTGRPLKVLISSWSPKSTLKSNDLEAGGGGATLKKSGGNYMYNEYADWWADSLSYWASLGVVADYISMQNEPDWDATWDSCRFEPSQTTSYAGYDQAYEAVYSEIYSRMGLSMPKMLAPETTGHSRAGEYINAMDDLSHVYSYAHHLYNCENGGKAGCGNEPDLYLSMMTNFAASYGYKPLMQTEYSDDDYTNTHA